MLKVVRYAVALLAAWLCVSHGWSEGHYAYAQLIAKQYMRYSTSFGTIEDLVFQLAWALLPLPVAWLGLKLLAPGVEFLLLLGFWAFALLHFILPSVFLFPFVGVAVLAFLPATLIFWIAIVAMVSGVICSVLSLQEAF